MCIAQYAIDSATFKKLFTAYRAAQATYKKDVTDFEKAGSDLKTAKKSMKIACKPCTVCTEQCKDKELEVMDAKGRCTKPSFEQTLIKEEDKKIIKRSLN